MLRTAKPLKINGAGDGGRTRDIQLGKLGPKPWFLRGTADAPQICHKKLSEN